MNRSCRDLPVGGRPRVPAPCKGVCFRGKSRPGYCFPRRRGVCFRGKSHQDVPLAEAQGRVFSLQVDAFCVCGIGENDGSFKFGGVQCTDLVEI